MPKVSKSTAQPKQEQLDKSILPDDHVHETFESLIDLVRGAQRQRASILKRPSLRGLHDELSKGQAPDSFVICCSDSRVSPPDVFNMPPGKLFTHENVGNLVVDKDDSMMAGIDYAINALKVRHILVLGHTGCGAMAGALSPSDVKLKPVARWLENTQNIIKRVDKFFPDAKGKDERWMAAAQENVLMQIEHLHNIELVKKKVAAEELAVFGFVYDIQNYGALSGWDPERERFVPINASDSPLPARQGAKGAEKTKR